MALNCSSTGWQLFGQTFLQISDIDLSRRHKIDSVGIDLNDLRALRIQPIDHLSQQIASDLSDTRGGVEVSEMALPETEVAVKTVDQNLERILQGLEMVLLRWIFFRPQIRFCLEAKGAEIGQ